jgi:exonuclease SbcC
MKLTMAGLRSYQHKTEIDFTDLSLFALIGDTGAGKSSIIEALCLALYGSTTWSGRNVVELMCDASDAMSVELVFAAAGDVWTVTRGHRRAGGTPTHKLTSQSGERENGADAVNRRVQAVLGLSKDQFLKAVVMPQGRFEELLKATKAQRTDILKGVFRLQNLDAVRAQATSLAGKWKEPIAQLRGERGTLPEDPAAATAAARLAVDVATKRRNSLAEVVERAAADAEVADAAERARQELTRTLEVVRRERASLDSNATEPIRQAAETIDAATSEATQDKERAADGAAVAAAGAAAAIEGFAGRDAAVAALSEMRAAAVQLGEEAANHASAADALAALDAAPPSTDIDPGVQAAVDAAGGQHVEAQRATAAAKAQIATAAGLYDEWSTRAVRAEEAELALNAAKEASKTAAAAVEQASEGRGAAEGRLRDAEEAVQLAQRADAAAAASEGCRPGDNCPVCATVLPESFVPPASGELPAANAALTAARTASREAEAAWREAQDAEVRTGAQLDAATTALSTAVAAVAEAADELQGATGLAVSPDLTEVAALAQLVADGERLATAEEAARLEVVARQRAAAEASSALAAAKASWEARREQSSKELRDAEAALARIRLALDRLPQRWRVSAPADSDTLVTLAGSLEAALSAHADLVEEEKSHLDAHDSAARRLLELETERQATVTHPTHLLVTAATRVLGCVRQLADHLDGDLALPQDPSSSLALDDIAAAVEAIHAAAGSVEGRATEALVAFDETVRSRRAAVAEALVASGDGSVGDLRSRYGSAVTEALHAADQCEQTELEAARAVSIDSALEVAGPFLAALDALAKLLTDGRFVGDLVRQREKALLIEASRILKKLSNGRFGFGEEFGVIDRDSRRERGPETLSGGERFQASLALALALVEIATRGGGQLEAVFVDEGFGSLDAASLDQALTTLGAVASDGKLVALVSHLRQVAEYVDQVILVERTDASGSTVRVLDPSDRDSLLTADARSGMVA